MNELEKIRKQNFTEEHDFLCSFINELEIESSEFLTSKDFIKYVVKKEQDYGLTFANEKIPQLVFYNLEYTFFENIEDHYGGRENDVTLGIVIDYFPEGNFNLSRDIVSKFGDVDYPKIDGLTCLSDNLKAQIHKMKIDFSETLKTFIEKSNIKI